MGLNEFSSAGFGYEKNNSILQQIIKTDDYETTKKYVQNFNEIWEIENVKAVSQSTSKYLDIGRNYLLKPDLILEIDEKRIIADTKYKITFSDNSDPVKSLSQSDLYQMTVYAVRFDIDEVIIFYPETIMSEELKSGEIIIKDNIADGREIKVGFYQLPVIDKSLLEK